MRFHFNWFKFGRKTKVEVVRCSTCTRLERSLENKHNEYIVACSETFRPVGSELGAYDLVEVESARSALKMHRSVCASVIATGASHGSQAPNP
jgi:hypothetical protein